MFVDGRMQEWCIWHDGSLWRIYPYKGGGQPRRLEGGWMSLAECQQVLIGYLRDRDKFGRAVYPDSPFVKKVASGSRTD